MIAKTITPLKPPIYQWFGAWTNLNHCSKRGATKGASRYS